ncbi:Lysophospholipase [Elusimicrobium minutum Pei191]|uniref:Lysophospholipase n=1 Tax=Elusimicrobium minutum (strain Pei191) TaxID=445932 RepID=B2KBI9_ELUMP|nr:alpha/beta hydrolase [Elusimicrobium minutum]ACC98011.1 Lysophospholipase [Elusimicrobium minutum Pei191]
MNKKIFKLVKYTVIIFIVLFFLLLAGVALRLHYVPDLQPWHTFAPNELTVKELEKATWQDYTARENKIFEEVHKNVILKTPESEQNQINRYFKGSKIYPGNFKQDWNRSYLLIPENPKGAVVLIHGLTDTPYSLRHIAEIYYKKGFVAVGLRVPGHGTVPGALTKSVWQDWAAATKFAVKEAKKLTPEGAPLHIAGFSQGGALAVKYALDALEDDSLIRPDRLVLISPMIGITRLSKLAEILAIPSMLPGFEKAAWISIIPEFNPFKYNSFPVNAVKQARLLIADVKRQAIRLGQKDMLKELPPIITFQSIADYTVSTPAIINDLYSNLPENESELVLFDINRDTAFLPLVRPVFVNMMSIMLPGFPQKYKITVIGNSGPNDSGAVERSVEPGGVDFKTRALGLVYPKELFSLSHISLPFPETDPLYGSIPDPEIKDAFGINLGLISNAQGERGVLGINTNLFFRVSSNPLFSYITARIEDIIDTFPQETEKTSAGASASKSKITQKQYGDIMKAADYKDEPF